MGVRGLLHRHGLVEVEIQPPANLVQVLSGQQQLDLPEVPDRRLHLGVAAQIIRECLGLFTRRQAQAGAVVQVAEERGEVGAGEVLHSSHILY